MAALNNNFTWREKAAAKEAPCYSIDPVTGEKTLINRHTMDQSDQLNDLKKKLEAAGTYSLVEIEDILRRVKR